MFYLVLKFNKLLLAVIRSFSSHLVTVPRTRGGLADRGVGGAELEAIHTQTAEAAVSVDAVLCARICGGALVHIHTGLPIIL